MASWRRNKDDKFDRSEETVPQSVRDWSTGDSRPTSSFHEPESSSSLGLRPDYRKGIIMLVSGAIAGLLLLIAAFTMFSVVPTKQVGWSAAAWT